MSLEANRESEIVDILNNFAVRHRPPIELRDKLDISYRIENLSVFIFEIRPHWKNKNEKIESPIAKTTYVKSNKLWKIFWMRADLKWHLYEPNPYVLDLENFIQIIEEDKLGCFWG